VFKKKKIKVRENKYQMMG